MLQRMSTHHIDEVAEIHKTSWDKTEISVKLGHDYIKMFYDYIVKSEYSFGFVYLIDGKVIAYATGFYDYHCFNKLLKKEKFGYLLMILLKRMISRGMTLYDLLNLFQDDKKLSKAKYPKFHLGALALAKDYKGQKLGRQAISETIGAVLKELEDKKYPGCWGLCNINNIPMRKLLMKFGFEEVDIIKMIKRRVVLYEKTFL